MHDHALHEVHIRLRPWRQRGPRRRRQRLARLSRSPRLHHNRRRPRISLLRVRSGTKETCSNARRQEHGTQQHGCSRRAQPALAAKTAHIPLRSKHFQCSHAKNTGETQRRRNAARTFKPSRIPGILCRIRTGGPAQAATVTASQNIIGCVFRRAVRLPSVRWLSIVRLASRFYSATFVRCELYEIASGCEVTPEKRRYSRRALVGDNGLARRIQIAHGKRWKPCYCPGPAARHDCFPITGNVNEIGLRFPSVPSS